MSKSRKPYLGDGERIADAHHLKAGAAAAERTLERGRGLFW
jgi:hypothetical protein